MFSIHVERVIDKPIHDVFAMLSDHENYAQFKGVDEANLLVHGCLLYTSPSPRD